MTGFLFSTVHSGKQRRSLGIRAKDISTFPGSEQPNHRVLRRADPRERDVLFKSPLDKLTDPGDLYVQTEIAGNSTRLICKLCTYLSLGRRGAMVSWTCQADSDQASI